MVENQGTYWYSYRADVYYFYNGHGDVVDTIDGSTNPTIGDFEYDAYGNQKNSDITDEYNPYRYAGEYYDAASGFIYLRGRFYNSETGRFINEDPIRDELNWYAYCGNNPVMCVDPSGHVAVEVAGVSAAVLAVVLAATYYISTPAGQKFVHNMASSLYDFMSITTGVYSFDEASDYAKSYAYEAISTVKTFNEFSNHSICVLYDANKEVRYVGRTNAPKRRELEHLNDKSLVFNKSQYRMQVLLTGLDKKTARGMEQLFIAAFTLEALDNARREIALKKMGHFSEEMKRAAEILGSSGTTAIGSASSEDLIDFGNWINNLFK